MISTLGDWIVLGLASGLYLSYLPAALFRSWRHSGAGLVGSLWAVASVPWLPLNPLPEGCVLLGAIALAVSLSDRAEELLGKIDDSRIVIDEFVGYWSAVAFLPRTPFVLVVGFVLFRVLDVTKLGWIRRTGELPGGWGIVMDDLAAGLSANVLLRIAERVHAF